MLLASAAVAIAGFTTAATASAATVDPVASVAQAGCTEEVWSYLQFERDAGIVQVWTGDPNDWRGIMTHIEDLVAQSPGSPLVNFMADHYRRIGAACG